MKNQVLIILVNCALILSGDAGHGTIRFRMTGEGVSRLAALGLVGDGDTFGNSNATYEYFRGLAESLPQADYRYEGNVNFSHDKDECEVYLDGFCMNMTNGHRKHNTVLLTASIIGEHNPDEVGVTDGWLRLWWD